MKKCLFIFFLPPLGLPAMASAEIVKCIDHGQVTYRNDSCNSKYTEPVPPAPPATIPPSAPQPVTQAPSDAKPVASAPIAESADARKTTASMATTTSFTVPLQNGSYFVSGTVAGIPTKFQIDTGASNTAVSQIIADQAGYFSSYCPTKVEAATANGMITVCFVNIPELTFGKFTVKNIDVIIMPNMQQEALLGMDLLQHYVIEQRARALKISK